MRRFAGTRPIAGLGSAPSQSLAALPLQTSQSPAAFPPQTQTAGNMSQTENLTLIHKTQIHFSCAGPQPLSVKMG